MPSKVAAGDLRHRVAFDRKGDREDAYGSPIEADFGEVFSCRAAYRHRGGSEAVMAARLQGRHILDVYVRSSVLTRQIQSSWRMRDTRTGTQYSISLVDSVNDRQWVYLMVESGTEN